MGGGGGYGDRYGIGLSPHGILTTNFASNCGFVKHRKGYFISLNNFPVPRVGNLTDKMLQNSNATPLQVPPLLPLHPNIDTCINKLSRTRKKRHIGFSLNCCGSKNKIQHAIVRNEQNEFASLVVHL